ncbi:C80 family cysteine peptidase [Pseudomonas alkylphenolica]|uniref:C80 family cysteine peptidase n=1 Tax=Pseudomonas alkylphenolica TaxID=237609 RepID=UPI0033980A57
MTKLSTIPRDSDDAPVNISLLLMEERPGYIRMNVALVNASSDGRFKDFFIENGRLVVPKDGVLNFSFGTAARSLAWQQQYRLKNEPATFRSPTYAPIRSVLVRTDFVEKYFANHLVSESTLREGFKAQVLSDGRKLLLTNVDRKVPNQVGIEVSGQAPGSTTSREVSLPAVLSDLINQHADVSSFQTIGFEGYRDSNYNADRDGEFVNVHELERSIGLGERQYLLEMQQGNDYASATPFGVMSTDGERVSSSHLSKAQTADLYTYNANFFTKLEQLRLGNQRSSRLFENTDDLSTFKNQLLRLLERNHITPGGVLSAEQPRKNQRDIKGNNLHKVLWERMFADSVWQSGDINQLLFGLATDFVQKHDMSRLLQGSYVQNDIAQAKGLLAGLSEQWRLQAVEAEQQRVLSENARKDPRDPKREVYDALKVENALNSKLLALLLTGSQGLEAVETAVAEAARTTLQSPEGISLRKQALFHALRPVAESLSKATAPTHTHPGLVSHSGGNRLVVNNRLNQPDPYLILNVDSQGQASHGGNDLVNEDKYRSYNQFRPDPASPATQFMRDLDTPFVGGISGTTQMVSNAMLELFGRTLTPKQYWQFQMANAAFMIRNGYHSFFETLYVAARYEPPGADSIAASLLRLFDQYQAAGASQDLKGKLYEGVMNRIQPLVNQGLEPAQQFRSPNFAHFGPTPVLEALDAATSSFSTLRQRIELVGQVYARLTHELRVGDEVLTPGFTQMGQDVLEGLDLAALKTGIKEQIEGILQGQRSQGLEVPERLDENQRTRIADLAVEGVVRQDFAKRTELMLYLETLGFSFKPRGDADRLLTFWSDEHEGYKSVLNTALSAQGRPGVATYIDVAALDFVHQLGSSIVSQAKSSAGEGSLVDRAAERGSVTIIGFLSSVYAASTADLGGTVYVMSKHGLKLHNYFWNAELPILRALQKAGAIDEIRLLHKPFSEYSDTALNDIGSRLTANDVRILANPNYLPRAIADEMIAAAHRRWLQGTPKADLISLHQEVKRYIDSHSGSGRNPAMISLLHQTTNKLLELEAMDGLAPAERIVQARENLVGEGTIWTRAELIAAAAVTGKRQGESYVRIQTLLDKWHAGTQRRAFVFPGDNAQNRYVEIPFNGDLIDRYTDQLKRMLPFDLLRSTWDIAVVNNVSQGRFTLRNQAGQETQITVDTATTLEQKQVQQQQVKTLQRFLLGNFSAETLPSQLAIDGTQIRSGAEILASLQNGQWVTDEAAVSRVATFLAAASEAVAPLHNREVDQWANPVVQGNPETFDSRYAAQIIIQSESDPAVARAAANLAGKHPDTSLLIQLDANGQMRLIHGDPAVCQALAASDKVRWQIVGHGRGPDDARTLGGLDAAQWATHLQGFQRDLRKRYGIDSVPARISLVGCSLERSDQQTGFGHQLTAALQTPGTEISVRNTKVAVDGEGRKSTLDQAGKWVHRAGSNKPILTWNEETGVVERYERLRAGTLLGRDGIDVGALLDSLQQRQLTFGQLGAAQVYALSRLFPGADEGVDQVALRTLLDNPLEFARLQDSLTSMPAMYNGSRELESLGATQLIERMLNAQKLKLSPASGLAPGNDKLANAMLGNLLGATVDQQTPFSYLDDNSRVAQLRAENRRQLLGTGDVSFEGGRLSAVLLHDLGLLVDGQPLSASLLQRNQGRLLPEQRLTFDPILFSSEMSKVLLQPDLLALSALARAQVSMSEGRHAALFAAGSDAQVATRFVNVLCTKPASQLEPEIAKVARQILGDRAGERVKWLAVADDLTADQRRQTQNLYEIARGASGFDLDRFKRLQQANPALSREQLLQQMALDAVEQRIAPGQDTAVVMQAARWSEKEARAFLSKHQLIGGAEGGAVTVKRRKFDRFIQNASGIDRIRLASAMLKLSTEQYVTIRTALDGADSVRMRGFLDCLEQQRASRSNRHAQAGGKFGDALDVFQTLIAVRDMVSSWNQMSNTDKGLNLTGLVGGVAMAPLSAAISRALSSAGEALGAVVSSAKVAAMVKAGVLDAALAPVTFATIGLQWQSFWSGNGDTGSYEYKNLVANTVITTVTTAVSLALTGVSIAASLSSAVAASVLGTLAASAGPIGVAIAVAGFIINGVVQGALQLSEYGEYFASTADQVAQFFAAWVGVETDALKAARVEQRAVGAATALRNTLNSDWEKTRNYLSDLFAKDRYGYLNYRERDNQVAHSTLRTGEDFSYALQQQVVYGAMARKETQLPNDGDEVWMEMGNQHPDYVATGQRNKRNLFNLGAQTLRTAKGGQCSDVFNLDANTKISSIDARDLSSEQLHSAMQENDILMLDAGGLEVALKANRDESMALVYKGNQVIMDGLTQRSGSGGSTYTRSPAVTRRVNQRVRVKGIESYMVRNADKAVLQGSGRQEFFDVSGREVTIAGGVGQSNVYSLNQGNRIVSNSNDTVLWRSVDASVDLQGAYDADGQALASQTLLLSLSSRYGAIKVRRVGQLLELHDDNKVLTLRGLYKPDGMVDNGKVLQLLDVNKYSFSLPGLGLIDDQLRSLESMAKTFVFSADSQRGTQMLSNDQAVNTYALKAGAGSFKVALHTNQLMQFMLEASPSSLSYRVVADTLIIRSSDNQRPLELQIEGYQAALNGQLIKIWLQESESDKSRLHEVNLPPAAEAASQPLAIVDGRQVAKQMEQALAGLVKVHSVQEVQALDLSRSEASYEVSAASSNLSLHLDNASSKDKLAQVRVGDDLVLYHQVRLQGAGLAQTPHLRIREYFKQPEPVHIRLNIAGVTSTLTVKVSQHLGDGRNDVMDGKQADFLAGGNGCDRYVIDVSDPSTSQWTLDNMSADGQPDILKLQGNINIEQVRLNVAGDDLQLLVSVPVIGRCRTVSKTIVLKHYVADSQARHLKLELHGKLLQLPEVDSQSGYFVHNAQTGGKAVIGQGVHVLRVDTFATSASQLIALGRPLSDFRIEVAGEGCDLKLIRDGQTIFVRDYYRNPEAVQFSWYDTAQQQLNVHAPVVFAPDMHSIERALYQELQVPARDWMAYIKNNINQREQVQALMDIETGKLATELLDMPGTRDFSVYMRVSANRNAELILFGTGSRMQPGFQMLLDSAGRLGFRAYVQKASGIEQVNFYEGQTAIHENKYIDRSAGELVLQFRENRYIDVYTPGSNQTPSVTYDLGRTWPGIDSSASRLAATRGLNSAIFSSLPTRPKVLTGLASVTQRSNVFTSNGAYWGVTTELAQDYLTIKGVPASIAGLLAIWDILTEANLNKVVDLHRRGRGQLSSEFIVDYVLNNRDWILDQPQADFAVALETQGQNQAFITRAFNYGLSVEEVQHYLKEKSAEWPATDCLAKFALTLRGDDRAYLDNVQQRISSTVTTRGQEFKFYFRPNGAQDALILKAVLMHKGYLQARAEQLASRMVAIGSVDYRRVDSLLNAGVNDDALLQRLVAAGVDGEDVKVANAERQRYESGKRTELIQVSSSRNLSQFSSATEVMFYAKQYLRIDQHGTVHQLGDQPYDLESFNRAKGTNYSSVQEARQSAYAADLEASYRYTFEPGQILGTDGSTLTRRENGEMHQDGANSLWEQGHVDRVERRVNSRQSWFGRSTPGNLVDGFDREGEAFGWRGASNLGFGDDASKVSDITFVSDDSTPDLQAQASFLSFDLKHKVVLASLTLHTRHSVAQQGQADTTRNGVFQVEVLQADNRWTAVSGDLLWTGQQDVMQVSIDTQGVPYQHYRLRGISGSYDRDRWINEVTFTTAAVPQAQGVQLEKLRGAMAAFTDSSGAGEHHPHSRRNSQAALVPSVT